jgi:hypothetical protein
MPEIFVAAAIALITLLSLHRRLSERNDVYDWVMAGIILVSFGSGALARMSVLALVLYVLPWAAHAGAIVSDVVWMLVG